MQIRRCMKCMHELRADETVCPVCGREYGTSQSEHYALRPGTILEGKYLVGEMLGQGGFGITYVGFDLLLEQKVAIKEYFPNGLVTRMGSSTVLWNSSMMTKTGTEKGFESFLKEARKMAKLGAIPGVVGVKTVFIENETAYIVMDYVEGETLLNKLQRKGPMTLSQCVRLLTPIMEALDEVHQHGIIHRDISPDNIMMRTDGKLVLLDLGAAKDLNLKDMAGNTLQSSQMVAKHGFSPLEQYSANTSIGSWTDVYAMCATIYYCCTRQIPPTAIERVMEDHLSCQPLLTDAEFRILKKGMDMKAQNRYQTMKELLTALTGTPDNAEEKRQQEEIERRSLEEEHQKEEKRTQFSSKNARKKWTLPAAATAVLVIMLALYVSFRKPGNQNQQAVVSTEQNELYSMNTEITEPEITEITEPEIQEQKVVYAYSDDPTDDALYTAEEFAEVVKAENVRDLLPLGTRIKMNPQSSEISDEAIEFELVAYQHFPLADGSGMAKTTWLAVNLLDEEREMNTKWTNAGGWRWMNAGGWRDSELRNWLNETLYPSLPDYWKNLMVQVEVSSTAGENSTKIVTSRDHLFLPARGEVDEWCLTSDDASAFYRSEIPSGAEGMTFTRFTDNASRVKKRQGDACWWWLRSPWAGSSARFAVVGYNGTSNGSGANYSGGVAPGFCM